MPLNLEELKVSLEARATELKTKADELEQVLREPHSADSEERAIETESEEVLEDLENAALAELGQIDAALKRIELGTYGMCTVCGEDIDEKRLEAVPFAAACVSCAT